MTGAGSSLRQARASTGLWAVLLLAAAAGVALTIAAWGDLSPGDLSSSLGTVASAAAYATLGALIVRRAGNAMGWMMLGGGAVLAFLGLASLYAVLGVATFPGSLPAARPVGALAQASFAVVLFTLAFLFLLFPTGALPSRRWLPVAAVGILLTGLTTAGLAVQPGPVTLPAPGGVSVIFANPLAVEHPGPVLRTLLIGTTTGLVVAAAAFLGAALLSLAIRYRAGGVLLRHQVKWLVLTGVAFIACCLIVLLATAAGQAWLTTVADTGTELLGLLGIPAAMTIAILRYRLYEIDRIISRTVTYAIVTGLLVGLYAGLVLLATGVLPLSDPVAVAVATLTAAALFSPLRGRVQGAVDRRFNRARYNADQSITAFAAQLKDGVDPDSVRDDLVGAVRQALEPAHISVWLRQRD
jgi:hypothetical protein